MSEYRKRKVILDVDTGSDDAIAIMTAVKSKDLEVLGVTVTHGNLPLPYCLDNTLRVIQFLGVDVPVFAGCSEPMVKDLLPGRIANSEVHSVTKIVDGEEVSVHQKELPLPAPTIKAQDKHACSFIVETLRNSKEKVTLIPVGPMTNIGMAIRMDPSIVNNIEEIICMGGGITHTNDTLAAECNFFHDPEAAKIMLHCGAKVTVLPLDATHSVGFEYHHAAKLKAVGSPAAVFAAELIEHRIEAGGRLGLSNGTSNALHDPLTVCYALDPSVLTDVRHANCDVDISGGVADGQLLHDTRGEVTPKGPTYIAFKGDREKYLNMLCDLLK